MKQLSLISIIIFFTIPVYSQFSDCDAGDAISKFSPNDISTYLSNRGQFFSYSYSTEYEFELPFLKDTSYIDMLKSSIWIGGIDESNNLRLAASNYQSSSSHDFYPGLLDEQGLTTQENCNNWDKIWTVTRYDIESHIQDYSDDGDIDYMREAIFKWPGKGNPHFLELNGFALPEGRNLAPFYDKNGNGKYEPMQGEYPLPEQCDPDAIPDIMAWLAFNDAGGPHRLSEGTPLIFDFQLTIYGFYCQDEIDLNRTLFASIRISNRDSIYKKDIHMGHNMNCSFNPYWVSGNYYACNPEINTFYQYSFFDNSYPFIELDSLASAGVMSSTFLSHDLSGFQYYANASIGNPPIAMSDPNTPIEYYYYISGKWRDGFPLTYGGSGYDPESTDTVQFLFSERPYEPLSWSMVTEFDFPYQLSGIGAVKLNDMPPLGEQIIDLMLSFHQFNGNLAPENIDILHETVPVIQEFYNNGFTDICTQSNICLSNCVWPGDATQDGIVNFHDLLDLKVYDGYTGPMRSGPLYWSAFTAENWMQSSPSGINLKHMDFNGDGNISNMDEEIFILHFGIENDFYSGPVHNPAGDNFQMILNATPPIQNNIDTLIVPVSFAFLVVHFNPSEIDSLYGLAFSVNYDTSVIRKLKILSNTGVFDEDSEVFYYEEPGRADFVEYNRTYENHITSTMPIISFKLEDIKTPVTEYRSTNFSVDNIRAVMKDGTEVSLGSTMRTIVIGNAVLDNSEIQQSEISIHPNPVNTILNVSYTNSTDRIKGIQIHGLSGEIISKKFPGYSTHENYQIDLSQLDPGIYFIRIISDKGRQITKKILRMP